MITPTSVNREGKQPPHEHSLSARLTAYRRTGITLKEGRRDEHGMEELDGVFSSPEKSPVRFTGNDTMMGSEGMSIDEGRLAHIVSIQSNRLTQEMKMTAPVRPIFSLVQPPDAPHSSHRLSQDRQ